MHLRVSTLCLVISGAIFLLTSCASTRTRHLDGAQFIKKARSIEQMNSASCTTYIGISQNRAYLEYQSMLTSSDGPRTTIFWTELDNLPAELTKNLHSGNPPWKNWQVQSDDTHHLQ